MPKKDPSNDNRLPIDPDVPLINIDELKRPPIVERYLDLQVDLKPAQFEKVIPEWLDAVSKAHDYPEHMARKHWHFRIDGTEENPRPMGRLYEIPRIQKLGRNGKLVKAIEVVPTIEEGLPRLRFQQGRPSEAVTRFSEFADGVRAILPSFLEANGIPEVNGIWLSYRNELSAQRYPEFNQNGSFQIGQILNFFKSNLAPVGSCVPPFRAEFSMKIETLPDRFLKFRVEDVPTSSTAHINMFLEYNGLQQQEARNAEAVFQELDEAHELILGAFGRHFSGEALEIFSK